MNSPLEDVGVIFAVEKPDISQMPKGYLDFIAAATDCDRDIFDAAPLVGLLLY